MLSTGMTEGHVGQQDGTEEAQSLMRSDSVANSQSQRKYGFLTAQINFGNKPALGSVRWALNIEFVIFRIGTGNVWVVEVAPILWLTLQGRDGRAGFFLMARVSALTWCFELSRSWRNILSRPNIAIELPSAQSRARVSRRCW